MNVDQVVQAYVRIREAREELAKRDDELKQEQKVIEETLLNRCNEIGAESIKTSHGLVMKTLKERYWTTDWDAFYPLVRENPELLEKRIAQGNLKAFMQEALHGELPPGVSVHREYAITVRKSNGV